MNIPNKSALMMLAVLSSVTSSAGIQGSGFRSLSVTGTVTAPVQGNSGTIFVSGVPYDTSHASIQIDGHAGTQGQIHKGDVVSLLATIAADGNGAAATQVAVNGSVQGKVSSVDVSSGTLFVLGQTVHVTSQTVFGAGLSGLSSVQSGATVEVGGFADSTGEWVATRIESKGNTELGRVVGSIQSLSPSQHSFYVNALRIDYGSAHVDAVLSDRALVSVQGVKFTADGSLVASQVHSSAPVPGQPGSIGRVQGLVTNYPSSAYFEIDGQGVLVNAQTRLALAVPLGLDVQVEVAGTFDTSGVLVADSVQTSR